MSLSEPTSNGTLLQADATIGATGPLDTGESGSLDGKGHVPAGAAEGSGAVDILLRLTEEVGNSGKRLLEVFSDRARQSVRKGLVRSAIGICAAVCVLLWLGASTLAVVRGACAGLATLWGDSAWAGDLAGGLLGLALAALAIAGFLRLTAWSELRRLRAKYQRLRSSHATEPRP